MASQSTASHRRTIVGIESLTQRPPQRSVDEQDELALERLPCDDRPVRHLAIKWPNASIRGTFAIGAAAPEATPPLYDMPKREIVQENAASAVFSTKTSPINVTVNVLNGGIAEADTSPSPSQPTTPGGGLSLGPLNSKKTIFICAKTFRNSVYVRVPHYVGKYPLHIRCKATTGTGTSCGDACADCSVCFIAAHVQRHALVVR